MTPTRQTVQAAMVHAQGSASAEDAQYVFDEVVAPTLAALTAARARIERLEGALHRDQTGLARAMNEVRGLVRSYDWLADPDAWGSYDYTERTVETLRKEAAWCFDALRKVIEDALTASGRIAARALVTTQEPPAKEPT